MLLAPYQWQALQSAQESPSSAYLRSTDGRPSSATPIRALQAAARGGGWRKSVRCVCTHRASVAITFKQQYSFKPCYSQCTKVTATVLVALTRAFFGTLRLTFFCSPDAALNFLRTLAGKHVAMVVELKILLEPFLRVGRVLSYPFVIVVFSSFARCVSSHGCGTSECYLFILLAPCAMVLVSRELRVRVYGHMCSAPDTV